MRDKGYIVILGSNIEPFKPMFNDFQRFVKEKYGDADMDWSNTEKSSAIVKSYLAEVMTSARDKAKDPYSEVNLPTLLGHDSTPFMYKEEKATLNKAFDENEKRVQAVIDGVKAAMSGIAADGNFFDSMNAVLSSLNPSESAKWSDIIGLFRKNDYDILREETRREQSTQKQI